MLERLFSKKAEPQSYGNELLELTARVRVLEREIEDLHASYRRIRASQAQNARDAPRSPTPEDLTETLAQKKRRVRMQLANRGFAPGIVPRGEEEEV